MILTGTTRMLVLLNSRQNTSLWEIAYQMPSPTCFFPHGILLLNGESMYYLLMSIFLVHLCYLMSYLCKLRLLDLSVDVFNEPRENHTSPPQVFETLSQFISILMWYFMFSRKEVFHRTCSINFFYGIVYCLVWHIIYAFSLQLILDIFSFLIYESLRCAVRLISYFDFLSESFSWCRKVMLRVDAKQGFPKEGNSPLELFQVSIDA